MIVLVIIAIALGFTNRVVEGEAHHGNMNDLYVQQTAYLSQYHDMMFEIVPCEGGWHDDAQNPTSSAFGPGQFINGTWAYVQTKWDMSLDRNSYYDQLYATNRLIREEGLGHWYASISCWGT